LANIPTNRSLGTGEEPVARSKYTHLYQKDYATWTAFIESEWNLLDEVWYDVHVGRAMGVPEGSPGWMDDVVAGVSRKRIDVVGRIGTRFYIIEVKPEANMKAIGQVVTYRNLFIKEFKNIGPVQALIVSTTCDADILDIANEQNVTIISLDGVTL